MSFSIVIAIFISLTINTNAKEYDGFSIEVDDHFKLVKEDKEDRAIPYNKNYFWASNKGRHDLASFTKYCALFDYYDVETDNLYLCFVSHVDIQRKPKEISFISINQYNLNTVKQGLYIDNSSLKEFSKGNYYPKTIESGSTVSSGKGFSVGLSKDGLNGGFSFSNETSVYSSDVQCEIVEEDKFGRTWNFNIKEKTNRAHDDFNSIVSQIFYLSHASRFNGQEIDIYFNTDIWWHLDVFLREQYHHRYEPNINYKYRISV